MRFAELAGRRLAVWGGGQEGRAAFAALRARLPGMPVAWLCRPDEAAAVRADAGADADVRAIEVDADALAAFEIVVKSPGISPYRAPVPEAAAHGVRFTSGSAIWFAEHPEARTLCVTATKGKSTTAALIAHLLRAAGRRAALAGNIGLPLLALPEAAAPDDWHVIELSSFQTRDFGGAPRIAVVGNVLEEHLDWHLDVATYRRDKLALLTRAEAAVLNAADPVCAALAGRPPLVRWFADPAGWHVAEGWIRRGAQPVLATAALPLPGAHNALNACAALAAAELAGIDAVAAAEALLRFRPLPHRLQTLGERDGLTWVNDSIATTPHAAAAALESLRGRAVAIVLGGFDRGLDWGPFAAILDREQPALVVAQGGAGARIAEALAPVCARRGIALERRPDLARAVACARLHLPVGGVVLLSPGAPSFDAFRDYAERGRAFAALAGFDPQQIARIEGLGWQA